MATLERIEGGERLRLPARGLVGRDPTCALCVPHPRVSREHAVIWWTGNSWRVRDLGSRNGTYVNGVRLHGGEELLVPADAVVLFGDIAVAWRLSDDSAPLAIARDLEGGEEQLGEGGVLALPGPDDPELSIFRDGPNGWVLEREDAIMPIADGATVKAGGRSWRVSLPAGSEGTMEPEQFLRLGVGLAMRFSVSSDEEYVEIQVVHGGKVVRLESRSYHYALLTLARQRLTDAALAEPERGWVYTDDLAKWLAMDRRTLNVHLHRARQQLGAIGLDSGGFLIERRPGTQQVRLGVSDISVTRLEA